VTGPIFLVYIFIDIQQMHQNGHFIVMLNQTLLHVSAYHRHHHVIIWSSQATYHFDAFVGFPWRYKLIVFWLCVLAHKRVSLECQNVETISNSICPLWNVSSCFCCVTWCLSGDDRCKQPKHVATLNKGPIPRILKLYSWHSVDRVSSCIRIT
jgi:hypothetical protein